jgi:sulfiredoxin
MDAVVSFSLNIIPYYQEGLKVPIQVLEDTDTKIMFSFGGCHRYEAHKRLGKDTIHVQVFPAPPSMLKLYLGASYEFIVENYRKQKETQQ